MQAKHVCCGGRGVGGVVGEGRGKVEPWQHLARWQALLKTQSMEEVEEAVSNRLRQVAKERREHAEANRARILLEGLEVGVVLCAI